MNDRNKPGESIHHSSFTTHNSLVPRLRFPEFRDAGEWANRRMGDLYGFHPTNTLSRDKLNYTKGDVKNIHYGDIHTKFATLFDVANELVPFINDTESVERIRPESYCIEGDVIFADASEDMEDVGKSIEIVNANNEKIVSGLHTILARQLTNRLAIRFGGYLFKSGAIREQIKREAQGAKVLGISSGRLSRINVCYPPDKKEQQKIADCLSSLDALIAAQAEKIDALKTHKKGLMQQLFPREGETIPRLRFAEFQDAGEWEIRELGSLAIKVGSGITPRGGEKCYKAAGRPFVRSQNVGWGELLLDDVAFIDENTHKSFDSTEIKFLDVLLNISGASIGRSAIADTRIAAGNVNQHVCIIRVKQDELNPILLNQFLLSARGQNQIDSFQAGGNRQGLNFGQIRSFKVQLPPSTVEQQKIADCLSSLDALIAAHTEKLAALKTHKKGLMQQLFPDKRAV